MEESKLYYVISTPGIKSSFDTIRIKMIHKKQHISNGDIFDIIVKEDIDKLFKKLNIENA